MKMELLATSHNTKCTESHSGTYVYTMQKQNEQKAQQCFQNSADAENSVACAALSGRAQLIEVAFSGLGLPRICRGMVGSTCKPVRKHPWAAGMLEAEALISQWYKQGRERGGTTPTHNP